MSESAPLNDEQKFDEGTKALHEIAEEVERERAERGRASVDGAPVRTAEEQAMADAAATSEDSHDVDNDTREDHSPGTGDFTHGGDRDVEAHFGVPGGRDQMPH